MKKSALVLFLIVVLAISGCGEDSEEGNESEEVQESPELNISDNSGVDLNETNLNETNTTANESDVNETNITATCIDTDGGQIYGTKGTVTIEIPKFRTVKDYCEDAGMLIEYYCKEDKTLGIDLYECFAIGDVCSDGACGDLVVNTTNTTNSSNTSNSS